MRQEEIVEARKKAEAAVADMPDGGLKVAAFQTILAQLLQAFPQMMRSNGAAHAPKRNTTKIAVGTTSRLMALADEGIFAQQRSLGDIKRILSERGWHYRLEELGTPLTRLVRKKHLRRTQVVEGGKKIWKYSNY